jgi:hypothetical protein
MIMDHKSPHLYTWKNCSNEVDSFISLFLPLSPLSLCKGGVSEEKDRQNRREKEENDQMKPINQPINQKKKIKEDKGKRRRNLLDAHDTKELFLLISLSDPLVLIRAIIIDDSIMIHHFVHHPFPNLPSSKDTDTNRERKTHENTHIQKQPKTPFARRNTTHETPTTKSITHAHTDNTTPETIDHFMDGP